MHRLKGAGVLNIKEVGPTYEEQLRVPNLSVGTYSIPAGSHDPQGPHTEDEVYIVVRGRGVLWTPARTESVARGDVLFVPIGEEHRFVEVTEDLCVLVIFGPAEASRRVVDGVAEPSAGSDLQ